MQFKEFSFNAHNSIIQGSYAGSTQSKGVVVLVHGFGEHSGRYLTTVIPMLLACNLAVVTYDNMGHGKSGGKRGHCLNYEALLDILDTVINTSKSIFSNLPMFLYGHSMGGNLVLNYALKRKKSLAGVVATSPYLRLAFQPPKWKMLLGKVLLNIMPKITLSTGLDPRGLSRIQKEINKYKTDPLVHDRVSPMFLFPIIEAGEWAIANASKLAIETLLLHGTGDSIIDFKGTKAFHKNTNITVLKLFKGAYHELHNDLCSDEMLITVSNWLKVRF